MRVLYINKNLQRSNNVFFKRAFEAQANAFLHITNKDWTVQEVVNFQPDHIHFNSAAQPVQDWLPENKIKALRKVLPNCVLTHYYCDALKSPGYRKKLIRLMDETFTSYDMQGTTWMPVPSDVTYWNINRNVKHYQHDLIFIGNIYAKHLEKYKISYTRHRTIKFIRQNNFGLAVVGDKWKKYYNITHFPRTITYEQTRDFYKQSFAGLNIVVDGLWSMRRCWSARLTHMMLCGLPCFTPRTDNIDSIFTDGLDVIFYDSDQQLIVKMDYYFKRRKLMVDIGKRGQMKMRELADIDMSVMQILEARRKGKQSCTMKPL